MRKLLLGLTVGAAILGGTLPAEATDALDALRFRWPRSVRAGLSKFAPYDDQDKAVWPADKPVPTGWLIVGHRKSPLQLSSTCHLLLIRKIPTRPCAEMTMWACQPLPAGWQIIEEFHHKQFPGAGKNAYRIRRMY